MASDGLPNLTGESPTGKPVRVATKRNENANVLFMIESYYAFVEASAQDSVDLKDVF